jgi:hypothetical protein
MGVKWLKEQIENHDRMISASFPGGRCLKIVYRLKNGRSAEEVIYIPDGQEYLIGNEVVDRVAKLGVTIIVPSHYSRVTAAAQGYGKMKNIRVLDSMKQFFAILHAGDSY